MDNPFIAIHKVEEPVFGRGTMLMKIPLAKPTKEKALAYLLCWLAILVLLMAGGAVLGWSARYYAGAPAAEGVREEVAEEEGGGAVEKKREAVRALIVQVMGQPLTRPLPAAPPPAKSKGADFDFANLRQGESLRRLGDHYRGEGQAALALQSYCHALKKNPKNQNAWQSLGEWYLRAGDEEMAKLGLETAFRLGNMKVELLSDLASLYRREGRLGEALALWDQSRTVTGTAPLTEINEGLALLESRDYERAALCLGRYVERVEGDTVAPRALAYAQVQMGEWEEARWTLKQALERAPDSAGLHADAAAVAAHGWLAHEALHHLEVLARLTSSDVAYQYLQTPAFSGFRRTALGRGLESVLLVNAGSHVTAPDELRQQLFLDIAPRFSAAP